MPPELRLRQEITPRRVALAAGAVAAVGLGEAVVRHFRRPSPTRFERHLELAEQPTKTLLQDPQFAGA
jgi:hypothetical protein